MTEGSPGPAVEDMFRDRWVDLVRLATLLVGEQAIAEDLVGEVFAEMLAKPREVEFPVAYMRTAVVNRSRSHHRRAWRDRARIEGDEQLAMPSTEALELWDSLRVLSVRGRTAIVLRYWEDLSTVEIAEVMGCRPGTVSSLLHRAVAKLRRELAS